MGSQMDKQGPRRPSVLGLENSWGWGAELSSETMFKAEGVVNGPFFDQLFLSTLGIRQQLV